MQHATLLPAVIGRCFGGRRQKDVLGSFYLKLMELQRALRQRVFSKYGIKWGKSLISCSVTACDIRTSYVVSLISVLNHYIKS